MPSSGWRRRVIQRVSAHEGKPYSINPNVDKAGLSYGIIQWTQKSKNLYGLLSFLQKKDPRAFAHFFGPNWQGLLTHAAEGERRLSDSLSDGTASGRLWEEPWYSRFTAAGKHPPFADAQWEYAEYYDSHIKAAEKISKILGIATERALVLFYDRAVQQGPYGAPEIAEQVAARWGGSRPPYMQALTEYAQANANRFRSSTSKGDRWRAVDGEYHKFAGKVDLYRSISKRNQSILSDPNLSDAPLNIDDRRVA